MKLNNRESLKKFALYLFAIMMAAIVISEIFSLVDKNVTPTVSAQQDPFLSQRISQIERQVSSLESRLIRVETDIRFSTPRSGINENNDADIRLLRSEIELLQSRLAETECDLLRLDERTLPAPARQARRKSETTDLSERCRLNPNVPLELIYRP